MTITITEDFDRAYMALRETEWCTNPADRTNPDRGLIRQGEIIWFNQGHMENDFVWQQALLANQTLRYVRHRDFRPVAPDQ